MGTQAGMWNFDGRPITKESLEQLASGIGEDGCEEERSHFDGAIAVLYRARYTTRESRYESQPYVSSSGLVFTWDGRLDNREDLICQLPGLGETSTDVEISGTAFERWGTGCFSKIIGDWALAIWDPEKKAVIFAKDYLGTRSLYYYATNHRVVWCTHLAPIVLFRGASFTLNEEYIAGYLAMYPQAHLTPYREIQSVPRASYVTLQNGKATKHRYWSFEACRGVQYKTDSEYEEHFRSLFRLAVRRRLRSDSPVLAELSGGIDSSSIVCMADDIIREGEIQVPRLDTMSLYDPTEPDGDERNYFSLVEAKRGRLGHHFDKSKYPSSFALDGSEFAAAPGWTRGRDSLRPVLTGMMKTHGYRVVLSGAGGDELLGGIPDPRPQLADLMLPPRPIKLARQLVAWSLVKKRPLIQLLFEASLLWLPQKIRTLLTDECDLAPWVDPGFARRFHLATNQLGPQGTYGSWRRSRRCYAQSVVAMSQQIASSSPQGLAFEERRCPYLDRTLVEFLHGIPPDQLLRPGQRRSLMRRALIGLVPNEILFRRTKGVTVRSILVNFELNWAGLENLFQSSLSSRHRFLNQVLFLKNLEKTKNGDPSLLVPMLRALFLELWLQGLSRHGLLNDSSERETPMCAVSG
ncbi:MAG TPA: asparagine synthase-related protein [Pyrinomonadaceae bacterium]|nr:asparagine synthase-related protein [Pyrinomonadaceae bacterium]